MPIDDVLPRLSVTAMVWSVLFCAPPVNDHGSSSTPRSVRLPPVRFRFLSVTQSQPSRPITGSFEVVIAVDRLWVPQLPASAPRDEIVAVPEGLIRIVLTADVPATGPIRIGNWFPPPAADVSYAASVSWSVTGPATPRWFRSAAASV